MKRIVASLLVFIFCFSLYAFGGLELSDKPRIGISLPTEDNYRWKIAGEYMKELLEEDGYEVDLQYASDKTVKQISQLGTMQNDRCRILIIAPVDGNVLEKALNRSKGKRQNIISFDRLLMNSDAVDYYLTFANYNIGTMQGKYIESILQLAEGKGPYNIEIFTGDKEDFRTKIFYESTMQILMPYIDNGQLVVQSNQINIEDVTTTGWSNEASEKRMNNILSNHYSDGKSLDAVLCSNDMIALGVIEALNANYNGSWPAITGCDCDIENVKYILEGKQSMSLFTDTRLLSERAFEFVNALARKMTAAVNNTTTYNNGAKIVPSYIFQPVLTDKNNYKEVLIDSGYYTSKNLE